MHEKKFVCVCVLQLGVVSILTTAVTFRYLFLEYDLNKT